MDRVVIGLCWIGCWKCRSKMKQNQRSKYEFTTSKRCAEEGRHLGRRPVLVLAGAGSGKTSVLTNRVAYLINEKNVSPYHILAITFTNKAANEMKERIAALVDYDVSRMAIATFHSICARFLRHDAELIGYMNNFTIYDTDDSTALIKKVMQNYDHSLGQLTPKYVRHVISMVKNSSRYGEPEEVLKDISEDFSEPLTQIYRAYNEAFAQGKCDGF